MRALSARRKCLDYIEGIAGLWFSLRLRTACKCHSIGRRPSHSLFFPFLPNSH